MPTSPSGVKLKTKASKDISAKLAGPSFDPNIAPGTNSPGVPTTTNPGAAAKAAGGARGVADSLFNSGEFISLLGATAQAIKPDGLGARLGGVAQEQVKRSQSAVLIRKALAGEDISDEDLGGLSAEEAGLALQIGSQQRQASLAEVEAERQAQLQQDQFELEKQASVLEQASVIEDEDERAAFLAENGVTGVSDVRTAEDDADDKAALEELKSSLRINEGTARIVQQLKLDEETFKLREELGISESDKVFNTQLGRIIEQSSSLLEEGVLEEDQLRAFIRSRLSLFGFDVKRTKGFASDLIAEATGQGQVENQLPPPPTKKEVAERAKQIAKVAPDLTKEQVAEVQLIVDAEQIKARAGNPFDPETEKDRFDNFNAGLSRQQASAKAITDAVKKVLTTGGKTKLSRSAAGATR